MGCRQMKLIKENFSRYEISSDGKYIYDKQRKVESNQFKSNGYMQCRLVDNEGCKHIMGTHTAVAMFYNDDYFPGCIVHHKDEDKHHNDTSNLQCMSRSEHSRIHADPNTLKNYIKEHGPANKGQKMSADYKHHCRMAALKRHHGYTFIKPVIFLKPPKK